MSLPHITCLPAGQERFGNMTRVYYRDAIGAFVVFDVTRSCTFEAVRKWKEDLDDKVNVFGGNRIAAVLLANKCDQEKDDAFAKTYPRMEQFCREHGFISWFETSAKVQNLLFFTVCFFILFDTYLAISFSSFFYLSFYLCLIFLSEFFYFKILFQLFNIIFNLYNI